MDNALYYLAINRQRGLATAMDTIANNVANITTTGFRREGLVFSEFVQAPDHGPSVSMADLRTHYPSPRAGELRVTGGRFDLAIQGEGFFQVEGAEGPLLTRAGAFQLSPEGFVVDPQGRRLLDSGAAPLFIPPDARSVTIAPDGSLSVDGRLQAELGVVDAPPETLVRVGDTAYRAREGVQPAQAPRIRQGALEGSNVDPVAEIARMIAVSRAYEQVQGLIEDEDERIRRTIETLGQPV